MKNELIQFILQQNKISGGKLIKQPVVQYVEKIWDKATIIIYNQNGKLSGFIAYYCNESSRQNAFLTMLSVSSEFSGQGVGKYLLDCSISDIARNKFQFFILDVRTDNSIAIKLYENAGFKIVSEKEEFLRMKKIIMNNG